MEIRTVRRPGERGTQKLVAQYGEQVVCIRYRYDPAKSKRYKTVELIVAEQGWHPPAPHPQEERTRQTAPKSFYTRRVGVRIEYHEAECANKSRQRMGCGIRQNGSGSSRKKRSEGWDWSRKLPSGNGYYM